MAINKIAIVFACLPFIYGMTASADTMKVSQDGTVSATGSIDFILPQLDSDEFYISGIELAVFEKGEEDEEWHIYLDDEDRQTKKQYIKNPDSLHISADLGDSAEYRDHAKYKAAYRYYVTSKLDASKITVAGKDAKDGWRLIGEDDPETASNSGFAFYKNSAPEIEITGISYFVNTYQGNKLKRADVSELENMDLPCDALKKGITPKIEASDYDSEDTLTFRYLLRDESTELVFSQGAFSEDVPVKTEEVKDRIQLKVIAEDGYGGMGESDWITLNIDTAIPYIETEFDDKGYTVKGNTLFSDFAVADNNRKMTDGEIYAKVYKDGKIVFEKLTEKRVNGIYRLEQDNLSSGEYEVRLYIYGSSGNAAEHTFYQTLDSDAPGMYFIPETENPNSTKYSAWQNISKKIILRADDNTAGIGSMDVKLNGAPDGVETLNSIQPSCLFAHDVTNTKTGKLRYSISVHDRAKELDRTNNTVKANSQGNVNTQVKEVWLDKKAPDIQVSDLSGWQNAPLDINAVFADNESSPGAGDNSGIREKLYAVCEKDAQPQIWETYYGGITISEGGVYDVYFKASDNAGNTRQEKLTVKVNNPSVISGAMKPLDSYRHTIYYSSGTLFVIKTTAYNTKFSYELYDKDRDDEIKTEICLKNRDDESVFTNISVQAPPDGSEQREIVLGLQYTKEGAALPDGVYDVLADITEVKQGGREVKTHVGETIGTIVIKRSAPPSPVISVSDGFIEIAYPEETMAQSLNLPELLSLCKRQYKTVKDAGGGTNGYLPYAGKFAVEKMTVTAVYTDIAGNSSTASRHITVADTPGGTPTEAGEDGESAVAEESRAANVYYIGTRRTANSGINTDIFKFIQ